MLVPPWTNVSISETLTNDPDFTALATLVVSANLTSLLLHDVGPLTLFAPSNAALAKVNTSSFNHSRRNMLVLNHIVKGNWYSSVLGSNGSVLLLTTLGNQTLKVQNTGNQTHVGGALITASDVLASNGVVHMIDGVLGIS